MPAVRHVPRDNLRTGTHSRNHELRCRPAGMRFPAVRAPIRPRGLGARDPVPALPVMSFRLYLSFLAASAVLVYAPGPVNLLTMNQAAPRLAPRAAVRLGRHARRAAATRADRAVPEFARASRRARADRAALAGAAYLVWLGCKQWLSRAGRRARRLGRACRNGDAGHRLAPCAVLARRGDLGLNRRRCCSSRRSFRSSSVPAPTGA